MSHFKIERWTLGIATAAYDVKTTTPLWPQTRIAMLLRWCKKDEDSVW